MHQNFKNILNGIKNSKNPIKSVIFGLEGLELTEQEKSFFKEQNPFGFILFSRNVQSKNQLKKLTDSLKDLMEREVPILIDQEGGRVNRFKEADDWKNENYPYMRSFGELAKIEGLEIAKEEVYKNFQKIADDLQEVGINTDCAPVLDLLLPETHDVIGRRAFSSNYSKVSELGRVTCDSLISKGVLPVIKHMPGHGRATCDSHLNLPEVSTKREILERTDFLPFRNLNDMPLAMTAHILYKDIDSENPATMSKKVIDEIIRGYIGFKGILMTDDLSMKALQGSFAEKTKKSLEAGCDLILHCNGKMDEMQEIANNVDYLNDRVKLTLEDFCNR